MPFKNTSDILRLRSADWGAKFGHGKRTHNLLAFSAVPCTPNYYISVTYKCQERYLLDTNCLEAIHKNTNQVHASICNGFPGDLCQLKHTDI